MGGSRLGVKNKRTIVRERLMRSSQTAKNVGESGFMPDKDDKVTLEAIASIKGTDFIMESLVALGEALGVYLTVARAEKDIDRRLALYTNASAIAQKLAPFTFPTLASIHTSTSKQSALERVGSVEKEEYATLMMEIAEKGVPRQAQAYLSKPTNGNGSGSNGGGVANR